MIKNRLDNLQILKFDTGGKKISKKKKRQKQVLLVGIIFVIDR